MYAPGRGEAEGKRGEQRRQQRTRTELVGRQQRNQDQRILGVLMHAQQSGPVAGPGSRGVVTPGGDRACDTGCVGRKDRARGTEIVETRSPDGRQARHLGRLSRAIGGSGPCGEHAEMLRDRVHQCRTVTIGRQVDRSAFAKHP